MGKPVLCGGKARYTQVPTVFFPDSREEYIALTEKFLGAETIELPVEFVQNARRFLYCQLFRSSLSFEAYLKDSYRKGYVQLQSFGWKELLPENSPTIRSLLSGISGLDANQEVRLRTQEGEESPAAFLIEEDE